MCVKIRHPILAIINCCLVSHVWLFEIPWSAVCQASLSFTISWSLLKLKSIKSVMPSNHLILCRSLLLLPSIFPSIRVFSNELALHIRWPKCWSYLISLSNNWLIDLFIIYLYIEGKCPHVVDHYFFFSNFILQTLVWSSDFQQITMNELFCYVQNWPLFLLCVFSHVFSLNSHGSVTTFSTQSPQKKDWCGWKQISHCSSSTLNFRRVFFCSSF